jgi:hypothetical protein
MTMNTTSQSPGSNAEHKPNAAEEHLHTLQDDAHAAIASAKEHGSAQFEQYRDTAAQQIETLAQSAQSAAEQMQEDDTFGLSHYITDIAQNMTSLASNLRGKSVDELLQQAGKLARDNPALFITGSVALGFGLSRFLRASSPSASSSSTADSGSPSATATAADAPASHDATRPAAGMSAVVEADQEFPVSHPHVGDVRHSGRPGIPDAPPASGASGGYIPTDPLGADATYPDSKQEGSEAENPPFGQSTSDRQAQDRLTKGDR